jgi:xanthine dehydrogenase accessory factor
MSRILEDCLHLKEKRISYTLVTLIDVKGSAPQDLGAKMIVTDSGLFSGTIGGGKVELAAIKYSKEKLHSKTSGPVIENWNLQTDIGMSCGGVVTLLFEFFYSSSWPIVIFGAGHVAQALTKLLSNLNCEITCIDSREDWVSKLVGVKSICHPEPKDLVKDLDPASFFISMTMGHSYDVPILFEIATCAPHSPYVGVIGSEIKGKKIKKELLEMRVSKEFVDKLRVPIGLPIGTNDPWEIAISVAAELLLVRDELKKSTHEVKADK